MMPIICLFILILFCCLCFSKVGKSDILAVFAMLSFIGSLFLLGTIVAYTLGSRSGLVSFKEDQNQLPVLLNNCLSQNDLYNASTYIEKIKEKNKWLSGIKESREGFFGDLIPKEVETLKPIPFPKEVLVKQKVEE